MGIYLPDIAGDKCDEPKRCVQWHGKSIPETLPLADGLDRTPAFGDASNCGDNCEDSSGRMRYDRLPQLAT